MPAIILHQTPPMNIPRTTFSMKIVKELPHHLPLEVWVEQRGYTRGYIWKKGRKEYLTCTNESEEK